MDSDLPKVLVQACGRPMIEYVLDALLEAGVDDILAVVGYRADDVRAALAHRMHVTYVEQTRQLGTGHAVQVCRPHLVRHQGPVVVVTGDSPLTQSKSIATLLALYWRERPACILGTLNKPEPHGLGRIVRDENGQFVGIVEEKDATPQQRAITEVNMSTYVFDCEALLSVLDRLSNDNQQEEYYITDCPGLLRADGLDVRAMPVLMPCEALSINSEEDLLIVEAEMRRILQ